MSAKHAKPSACASRSDKRSSDTPSTASTASHPSPGEKTRCPARTRGPDQRRTVVTFRPSRIAGKNTFLKNSCPMTCQLHVTTPQARIRSPRAATVAKWFGLDVGTTDDGRVTSARETRCPIPNIRKITLITGPSGAGKSSLLRRFVRRAKRTSCVIDLPRMRLPDRPIVDCFGDAELTDVLNRLSRVGLGEAWSYLHTPSELSDGQRWRLRLAVAMHQADRSDRPVVLVADEFAALLDRVTAAVVSRAIRKWIAAAPSLTAIFATCHDDVIPWLDPDLLLRCDFGVVEIEHRRHT